MPASARDLLSRALSTVVRTLSVSPWNTGLGKRTSVMPRLAMVVPSVVSPTLMPITRPRVKMLLTSGRPIGGATVSCWNAEGLASGSAQSDQNGYYVLPLLSPGLYRVRAEAGSYQAKELQDGELAVASRLEIEFRMRPLSDVWESGQYNSVFLPGAKTVVTFYGPDVDSSKSGSFEAQKGRRAPLETTVSDVINSAEIATLPLGGRDVYTMLVTQAGVTSDAATGRGLGLSANGQRPSASNSASPMPEITSLGFLRLYKPTPE